MWRIFVPLAYLRIEHPEKIKFDLYLPMIMAVIFLLPLLSENFQHDALGELQLIDKIGSFLGVLVGFFIAALAAVATFNKTGMDEPMAGEPKVRLRIRRGDNSYFEDLTRRRFLSFLFGYMAFLSLVLYLLGYVYVLSEKYLISGFEKDAQKMIFTSFWIIYSFCLANVLSNTFLGLYYLTDRIHRGPSVVIKNGRKIE